MQKVFVLNILVFLFFHTSAQVPVVENLRCGMSRDPIGVESLHPHLSWELQSTGNNIMQSAYRILVATDTSLLAKGQGNIWDSQKIPSSESIQVPFQGKQLDPAKKYFWKVMVWDNGGNASAWSKVAVWQMGLLRKEDWNHAQWIGYEDLIDSMKIVPLVHGRGKKEWGTRKDILPILRKTFTVQKPVKRATAFVCGLGQFLLSINGSKAGNHYLDPGWTQYSKQALYVGFDITQQVEKGENVICVMLGNGFYYIPGERYRKLTGAFGYPKMMARFVMEYEDGTTESIISNNTWKADASPITFSSVYGGEDYDANLYQQECIKPGFNDASWKKVVVVTGPEILNAQLTEPVRVIEDFIVRKKVVLSPTEIVYDLGQNFSGIPFITVTGHQYDTIRIIPAELTNAEGRVSQSGSGGPFIYNYILKGDSTESWSPLFSYYGFRYLQVKCIAGKNSTTAPVLKYIGGMHLRNGTETSGKFSCSNELFNQTFNLINWAIKSNTMSLFTDCPHREKLGWLEQTYLMGNSVQYNFDAASLFKKVIQDIKFAQTDSGMVPTIAPEYVQFEEPFRDSPEWGSAAIILPWYYYQWYGDKEVLTESYKMMKDYADYLHSKLDSNILGYGLGDWYDLGPARPGFAQLTPKGVTATATYYYDLLIMQQVATLLGKLKDARHFKKVAKFIRRRFNQKFFRKGTNQYATGSQTANAMALYMNLVDPQKTDEVANNLVKDIRSRQNALTAGDIGYRYVLQALEQQGHSDVIFDMNNRSDVPGYGYQIKQGATALTESWQALPMASNNHFMLGHLMEWFYSGLAGIRQEENSVAYKKIVISPEFVGDIEWASAWYHCPYGIIKSDWIKAADFISMHVEIPPNTTAEIQVPYQKNELVSERNAIPFSEKIKNGRKILTIGSGSYNFKIKSGL